MKLSSANLSELADLAISAATEAGQMIVQSRPHEIQHKAADAGMSLASQVVTEVDRRSQDIILHHLNPTLERFELGLLTEEQDDDGGRLVADYFWCIDPLDGTLPFIEGSPGYAVSIALVGRDGKSWIGVTYDPVEGVLWHAISGVGAFRNRVAWSVEQRSIEHQAERHVLSVFVDRSFEDRDDHEFLVDALHQVAQDMGLDGLRLEATAGAVMNACGALAHPPACYMKFPKSRGGGSLWDYAATACLFHEAGAIATDIYGGPLDLNRADSTLMAHRGVLFATNEALAERIRALHLAAS